MSGYKSEVRDGMRIDWDVPIEMDDGTGAARRRLPARRRRPLPGDHELRPVRQGPRLPGGLQDRLGDHVPRESRRGGRHLQQVPELGGGRSGEVGAATATSASASTRAAPAARPAISPTTTRARRATIHQCIEWAAQQPWCSGKVGLNGISYYATNQWRAAASQPPHLAAICVWEGWVDSYRDGNRHGGIVCTFRKNWQDMQVKTVQHGVGERGAKSRVTGELVCGPETLSEEELRPQPRGPVGRAC